MACAGGILLAKHVRVTVHHVAGPVEGLVLDWRGEGGLLQALVTYEVRDRIVTDWVPAMSLTPVEDDPDSSPVPSPG